ncbi:DNA-directed RNA polymerase subunit beta' [Dehalococcoidia bacterium]|nr:DNA-directed RNA polymerase subunit beta' [Dehalococcoidia bacterium]
MHEFNDFSSIRISLASPEQIKSWSYGEVTKPETINYRTLKPERDGLFCERIFGPTKDFECYCGKYKKIRYKGVICDKCGVEVTHSSVRRERMGHIQLAAPVAHIWFVKVTPSRLGLLLDLSPRKLEQVIYFAKFIITRVDEDARARTINKLKDDLEFELMQRHESAKERIAGIGSSVDGEEPGAKSRESRVEGGGTPDSRLQTPDSREDAVSQIQHQVGQDELRLHEELVAKIEELEELEPLRVLGVNEYRELKRRWGDIFEAKIGAEAILDALTHLDLEKLRQELHQEVADSSGQHWKKVIKRLRVVEAFLKQGTKPEWMIMTVLPVIPPELRPMVQLDGGRFATSDLNDLYRRVINRNNRLRRLMEMGTPEVIIRNEKRMLQEAVDSLIDNGRRGRAVTTRSGHELKSLSDMLRGKQGHFRQNLLGKRVDYSGRSVIVPGPELKLHQCGLPKRMALELFKPFVMRQLIARGLAYNVRNAKRTVEQGNPIVWDILEEVVKDHPVLMNRAPTLHRLGIQAFQPVLIDDSAIQLHPLVCAAFNADFDGDQMAVHIPLSRLAIEEAREVMLSSKNMLLPSSGEPVVVPTMELALGCYYLTIITPGSKGEGMNFADFDDARMAYDLGVVDLGAEITVHHHDGKGPIKTSVGRIIFNDALPDELGFRNELVDKKLLKRLTSECYRRLGNEATASMLDGIKRLGFEYSTKSGLTVAISDLHIPADKNSIIHRAEEEVGKVESQFQDGLKTEDERYQGIVRIWSEATDELTRSLEKSLDRQGSIYMMANSGARGNIGQIRQMAGMRGLMSDPSGRIIELPIKTNFREGLSVLEYFISTHGARKGLADTALRTSDSGYLTRRLIDVAQEVIVKEEDCGTEDGLWLLKPTDKGILPSLSERIVARLAARPVIHPETGEIIVDRNGEIDTEKAAEIAEAGVTEVCVRSPLRCRLRRGVCQRCYGIDLGRGQVVDNDVAVGIIAAQSIGEPGTQLTMRTFHTGGVAGLDIISGLPRVEELLEARVPKGQAVIAQIDGVIDIIDIEDGRKIKILNSVVYRDEYPLPPKYEAVVSEGQVVDADQVLAVPIVEDESRVKGQEPRVEGRGTPDSRLQTPDSVLGSPILARVGGKIEIRRDQVLVLHEEREEWEHLAPPAASFLVRSGDTVKAGDQLTEGTLNPQDILQIMGMEAVQRYLVDEVQKVYRSQGVNIHDKHIEIIVGQMLRRVRIDSPGDTRILPGELIDRFDYETLNANVLAEGGEPATAHPVLLGITRASLSTPSFLAAASFQETTRVLTEAAIMGSVDRLVGLKENVIIGKLIPSRSKVSRDQLEAAEILAPEPLLSQGLATEQDQEQAPEPLLSQGQARQELALIEPMQLPAGE